MHSHPSNHTKPSKTLGVFLAFVAVIIFNLQLPHSTITKIDIQEQIVNIETNKEEKIKIDPTDPILSSIKIGTEIETSQIDTETWAISDLYRLKGIKISLFIFVAFCLIVTNFNAIGSLIAIVLSILVIFNITLPLILNGIDPILVCLGSCIILVPISFYLSHGFNKKAHLAGLSSLVTLAFAATTTVFFTKFAGLTGLSTEEARFLMIGPTSGLDFKGILFGGIMISLIGILDDITITQTSIVKKLKKTSKNVYKEAMHIGQDHIASLINTIFLIYAGAALPTLLLFSTNPQSLAGLLNFEPLAEEIIRSIIGSLSLIAAVPISTWFAERYYK